MFWLEDAQKRKNGLHETQGPTGYERAEADLGRTNQSLRLCMMKLRRHGDPRALILGTFTKQTSNKDPTALGTWKAAFSALPASPDLAAPPPLLPASPTLAAPPPPGPAVSSTLSSAVSTTPTPLPPSSPPSLPGSAYLNPSARSFSQVLMAVTQIAVIAPGTPSQHSTPPPDLSTSVSSTPSRSSIETDAIGSESSSTERDSSFKPTAALWHPSHLERFSSEALVKTEVALALMHLQFDGKSEPRSTRL